MVQIAADGGGGGVSGSYTIPVKTKPETDTTKTDKTTLDHTTEQEKAAAKIDAQFEEAQARFAKTVPAGPHQVLDSEDRKAIAEGKKLLTLANTDPRVEEYSKRYLKASQSSAPDYMKQTMKAGVAADLRAELSAKGISKEAQDQFIKSLDETVPTKAIDALHYKGMADFAVQSGKHGK